MERVIVGRQLRHRRTTKCRMREWFLNSKQVCFEEGISPSVWDGRSGFNHGRKTTIYKLEIRGPTKSCETAALVASGFHFCVSVISTGQHDTAPTGAGFLSFPGADGWPL